MDKRVMHSWGSKCPPMTELPLTCASSSGEPRVTIPVCFLACTALALPAMRNQPMSTKASRASGSLPLEGEELEGPKK